MAGRAADVEEAAPRMSNIWTSRYMSHDEEYGLPRVRQLVGAGPSDKELMEFLAKANHCVSVAAEMFWGHSVDSEPDEEVAGDDYDDDSDSEFERSLQVRFDYFFCGRPMQVSDLNAMAVELADAGETGALMQIWDELNGSKGAAPATWVAVERLHARGKGNIPSGTLRLSEYREPPKVAAARRLHKICKGRRVSARSRAVDSQEILPRGLMWVRDQQAAGVSLNATGRNRIAIAKQLQKALSINLETARGLVTKLKRSKAF